MLQNQLTCHFHCHFLNICFVHDLCGYVRDDLRDAGDDACDAGADVIDVAVALTVAENRLSPMDYDT